MINDWRGPNMKDMPEDIKKIVRLASSIAKLNEELVVKAILSFHAAVAASLADENVYKKIKEVSKDENMIKDFSRVFSRSHIEGVLEGMESLGDALSEEIASRFRERVGDTTSKIDVDELSDVANKVFDVMEVGKKYTIDDLCEMTGLNPTEVHNAINELKRAELVKVSGEIIKKISD